MWAVAEPIFHGLPDTEHLIRVLIRLLVAGALGAVIGFERQHEGKAAGMRTHMLVALGAALIILLSIEAGYTTADQSRIIQGIVTGLGFIGGGSILKLSAEHQIRGLTTAASIGVTAGCGLAVGLGWFWPALLGVFLGWFILQVMHHFEHWIKAKLPPVHHDESGHGPEA